MTPSGITFYYPWEVQLMEWFQMHLSKSWVSFLSFFTLFGEAALMIMIVGFAYWNWDKKMGRAIGLNTIAGLAWQGFSFPSGHSTTVMGVFGSLALYLKKRWVTVAAVIIVLLTGISRSVVGAHYPTDVLTGWLFGLIGIFIVQALDKKLSNNLILYGILLITIIPGFFYCKTTDYFDTAGLLIGFMAGMLMDEYYVHFENTRKPISMILRMVGGIAIFVVLNTLLKMPFSQEFLDSRTTAAMMMRCVRYGIISFVEYGIYPMLFKLEKRPGK